MKQCSKCKKIKPLSEFYKNKSRKDGLRYNCIDCTKQWNKKHPQTQSQKKYYQKNKKIMMEKTTKYTKSHPDIRKKAVFNYNHSEKRKKCRYKYKRTERGKQASAKNSAKRIQQLNFELLFNNPFKCNTDFHHISNEFVVAIPRFIHKQYSGYDRKLHRELLKPIVEMLYNISYTVV